MPWRQDPWICEESGSVGYGIGAMMQNDMIYCFVEQYFQLWILLSSLTYCRNNRQARGLWTHRKYLQWQQKEHGWCFYGEGGRLVVWRLDYGNTAQGDWMTSSLTWPWSMGNIEVVGGALSPRDWYEKSFTMGQHWDGHLTPTGEWEVV